jgi:peroxiredoxin
MEATMMRLTAIVCLCTVATGACGAAKAEPAAGPRQKKAAPPKIPPVMLSKQDAALCRVRVGDQLPPITLPQLRGGGEKKLADLFGQKATVVIFWNSDRRMTRQQLADVGPDVVEPYGQQGVAVIGIVVKEPAESAEAALKKASANFTNLLDNGGAAFKQVGSDRLPRTYLLDPRGKILWFDIEYSLATRRELKQALRAVAGEPAAAGK